MGGMMWLGEERGYLSDWITQLWVGFTGRRLDRADYPWLEGPSGGTRVIGQDFFAEYARKNGLKCVKGGPDAGLIENFADLASASFDASRVHPAVADFYERTNAFEMDAWAQWRGMFRPFGWLIYRMFSRRLQQLNLPQSGLDTSRGIVSNILQIIEPDTGQIRHTAWIRQYVGSQNTLYAGSYSLCRVPGYDGNCIKVVFPLPNGNGIVFLKPELRADGSVLIRSDGRQFGGPGFYFTVRRTDGRLAARYLRPMKESIHVYHDKDGVRADHHMRLWGREFLKLHYRLRRIEA